MRKKVIIQVAGEEYLVTVIHKGKAGRGVQTERVATVDGIGTYVRSVLDAAEAAEPTQASF